MYLSVFVSEKPLEVVLGDDQKVYVRCDGAMDAPGWGKLDRQQMVSVMTKAYVDLVDAVYRHHRSNLGG
jgi:hypothetical protein